MTAPFDVKSARLKSWPKRIKIFSYLSLKKVREYEEISLITNKRLIQKSYNAFEIDYSKNPISNLNDFEIYRDTIFITLQAIKVVVVEKKEYTHRTSSSP